MHTASSTMQRITLLLILFMLLSTPPEATASSHDETVRPFFTRFCVDCHGREVQKGKLRLDTLAPDFVSKDNAETWSAVVDRLRAGEMPPPKRPRPEQGQMKQVVEWIEANLRSSHEKGAAPRVALRRLNRVEFEYTLRDLLALPHLDVKEMLPPDASAHGFDNVAEAQDFSYVQMARYLDATERALDLAMCMREKPATQVERMVLQRQARFNGKEGPGRGESRHVDEWVVLLRQPNSAQTPWRFNNRRPIYEGEYTIRVRCRGVVFDRDKLLPQDRRHVLSIYTREKRWLSTFDVPAEASVVEFRAWLHEGDKLELFCASLDDRTTPGAGGAFRPYSGPGIAVEHVEIEGPFYDNWPTESHRRLFGDLPVVEWAPESGLQPPAPLTGVVPRDPKRPTKGIPKRKGRPLMVLSKAPVEDAERLLRAFMTKANCRPFDEEEVQRCLGLARAAIEQKLCFQDVMRIAYKAALCSPDFLFFQEKLDGNRTQGERSRALDGWALASRLSYFLWRSMPDDKLLSLARAGELHRPDVLHQQVDRMLDDPKSARFIEDFTGQWLDLHKIHDTAPDRYLYPEYFCDNFLVESAVRETHAYFKEMLDKDLGARALVSSDFAMVNERLARLYGIKGVTGSAIRRVELPKDTVRSGVLTQASVLKVTANGLTTSPVLRGVWVLDRLLGRSVPPPPPDAGAIDPDTRGATTIREQLAKHRSVESCATCHVKIDPPGFALENFDVMGAWRDRYRSFEDGDPVQYRIADRVVRFKHGQPVDASGETHDGRAFRDVVEFREHLLAEEEQLARNLTQRLVTFATGAGIRPADRAIVEEVLTKTRSKKHGLRSLIHEVVQSPLFLTR